MPVRLRLDDGTIREYPVTNTVKGAYYSVTRCGRKDCEHLDCALDFARKMREKALAIALSAIVLVALGVFAFLLPRLAFGSSLGPVTPFDLIFMVVVPSFGVVVLFVYARTQLLKHNRTIRDLEEYTRSATIGGRPTRQITSEIPPETGDNTMATETSPPGILREIFTTGLVVNLWGNTEYQFGLLRKERFAHAVSYFAVQLALFTILSIGVSYLISLLSVTLSHASPTESMNLIPLATNVLALYLLGFLACVLNGFWLHLWIFLFGGRSGLRETFRLVFYGSTPALLLGWIPMVGSFIGGIITLAMYYHGIIIFHDLSGRRAIAAVLVYFFVSAVAFLFLLSFALSH